MHLRQAGGGSEADLNLYHRNVFPKPVVSWMELSGAQQTFQSLGSHMEPKNSDSTTPPQR